MRRGEPETDLEAADPGSRVDGRRHVVRLDARDVWTTSLAELWAHREVLYFLVVRNLKVRYRQTVLGAAWAVAQPLALMLVFVVFVERIIDVPSQGVPYPLFAFAALVPWTLFAQAVTNASESVVRDINLVSKIYVPRLLLPLAAVGALLVDFAVSFGVLLLMMAGYRVAPQPQALLWIPLLTVLAVLLSVAVGVLLSALMVMYRDIRSLVPLLVQVWLFASPVAYPSSLVPEQWQVVYALNPMVTIIDGFRAALLDTPPPSVSMVAASAGATVVLLCAALVYFRRSDQVFADVI
jgi:homopolymeric O-antigen transport system permease protein